MPDRPTIRLRPNRGRRFHEGAPWLYADEIVTDRRTKALQPGTVATLENAERTPLATVAVNMNSQIMARVLDRDPEAEVDGAWLRARLAAALAHRERLFGAPFYRWVHAEGDGLPGLVIDRFGAAAAIQPNAAWAEVMRAEIVEAAAEVAGLEAVVVNASGRARRLEGLDDVGEVALGSLTDRLEVPMNGARYMADLVSGQKTGLFYDQRPNHAFVASLAEGGDVLDVFSHVGGFSLAALAGGAASALAVDSSQPALDLAEEGARRSGFADRFAVRKGPAFETMRQISQDGARFDVVISDPPAFAPSKQALEKGLRAYETAARLAAGLTRRGGYLALCSCSHAATPDLFRAACAKGIRATRREAALVHAGQAGPDHPAHAALPETSYLKALVYRIF